MPYDEGSNDEFGIGRPLGLLWGFWPGWDLAIPLLTSRDQDWNWVSSEGWEYTNWAGKAMLQVGEVRRLIEKEQ